MKQFLSWEGRMNRGSFLGNNLLATVIGVVGILIILAGDHLGRSMEILFGLTGMVVIACASLRNMAITARRLHDLNVSGMLVWPYLIVSGLAGKIEGLWVIGLLAFLVMVLLPGNKAANQYGDVPGK